jgi:hypothetical protein
LRLVYVFLIVHRYYQHSLRLLVIHRPRHALSLPTFVLSPNQGVHRALPRYNFL